MFCKRQLTSVHSAANHSVDQSHFEFFFAPRPFCVSLSLSLSVCVSVCLYTLSFLFGFGWNKRANPPRCPCFARSVTHAAPHVVHPRGDDKPIRNYECPMTYTCHHRKISRSRSSCVSLECSAVYPPYDISLPTVHRVILWECGGGLSLPTHTHILHPPHPTFTHTHTPYLVVHSTLCGDGNREEWILRFDFVMLVRHMRCVRA